MMILRCAPCLPGARSARPAPQRVARTPILLEAPWHGSSSSGNEKGPASIGSGPLAFHPIARGVSRGRSAPLTWRADRGGPGSAPPWACCPCRLRSATARGRRCSPTGRCPSSRRSDRRCVRRCPLAKKPIGYGRRSSTILPSLQRDHAVLEVGGRDRRVVAEPERVVLVDPGVVARTRRCSRRCPRSPAPDTGRSSSPPGTDRRSPSVR